MAILVGLLGRESTAGDSGGVLTDGAVAGSKGRLIRLCALVVLLLLAAATSARLGDVMGEDGDLSSQSALEGAMSQTATGGSEFQPVAVNGPSQVPAGVVSVFFRPFPWEALSLSSLIAAAESLVLAGLVVVNWRRVANLPRYAVKRPFVLFSAIYALLFAIGFSYIANFGILARQRVQALPVLLVILALPPVGRFAWISRARHPMPAPARRPRKWKGWGIA